MEIIYLEKNNLKKIINDEKKILIDFYANWCGPCKMLGPILEKHQSNIKVIKIDTDKFDELSREYGIMSIPTLVLIENGNETRQTGGEKHFLNPFMENRILD